MPVLVLHCPTRYPKTRTAITFFYLVLLSAAFPPGPVLLSRYSTPMGLSPILPSTQHPLGTHVAKFGRSGGWHEPQPSVA